MSHIVILHNPKAGDTAYPPETLLALFEQEGFSCRYASLKEKGWQHFDEDTRLLAVAGGDGSVRTVAGALLQRTLMERQYPMAIVPLGTANNLSKTLGIAQHAEEAVASLRNVVSRRLDVGFVEGLGQTGFFLEGMGAGIFPKLMKKMHKQGDPDAETAEEKLYETLLVLEQVAETFEAIPVTIMADGARHEGEYLMVEVMNIKSIGPNLVLAENADPADGEFEVVLIPAGQRYKLLNHIRAMLQGQKDDFVYTHLKARELVLSMPKTDIHIDDEIVKHTKGELNVYLKQGILEVLLPEPVRPDVAQQ